MEIGYRLTEEKYDCPNSLNALVGLFDSLQCGMSGCMGDVDNRENLENTCRLCEHYIVNVEAKDMKELSRPV